MPYSVEGKLVVAISSRALFDFEEENRVFDARGEQAYIDLQYSRMDVPAKEGVAFPLVKKLLAFNSPESQRVEVVMQEVVPNLCRISYAAQALGGKPRAPRDTFEAGLSRVIQRSAGTSLCLMCAEKEPLDCHRTILVSRGLAERGETIEHLLADGTFRPHAKVEETLLGKDSGDLFEDRKTRLARAYDARDRAWSSH